MEKKSYRLSAALALLTIGCMQFGKTGGETHMAVSQTAAEIVLTTDSTEYESPREITLTLVNNSSHTIGFNLCLSVLERRIEDSWKRAEARRAFDCNAHMDMLETGGEKSFPMAYSSSLPAGAYRFRNRVTVFNGDDALPYPHSETADVDTYSELFYVLE